MLSHGTLDINPSLTALDGLSATKSLKCVVEGVPMAFALSTLARFSLLHQKVHLSFGTPTCLSLGKLTISKV